MGPHALSGGGGGPTTSRAGRSHIKSIARALRGGQEGGPVAQAVARAVSGTRQRARGWARRWAQAPECSGDNRGRTRRPSDVTPEATTMARRPIVPGARTFGTLENFVRQFHLYADSPPCSAKGRGVGGSSVSSRPAAAASPVARRACPVLPRWRRAPLPGPSRITAHNGGERASDASAEAWHLPSTGWQGGRKRGRVNGAEGEPPDGPGPGRGGDGPA
jgi:hypothetical protein